MITKWCLNLLSDSVFLWFHVLQSFFLLFFCEEFCSVNMARSKGDSVNGESEKHRMICERNSDDDDVEIQVYEDLKNELVLSESDSSDRESASDDGTDVRVVIPLDCSLLYCPVHLCFTANVGINVVVQSCEGIMAFFDLFCTPQFYEYFVNQL